MNQADRWAAGRGHENDSLLRLTRVTSRLRLDRRRLQPVEPAPEGVGEAHMPSTPAFVCSSVGIVLNRAAATGSTAMKREPERCRG